jgi:Uma2 family endonuclease
MTIASIRSPLQISWELLPDDYPLPDDPVDNIDQPLLAEALRESLDLAHQLPSQGFVSTNFGICTQVNDKFVIKAPDWVYIPRTESQRSRRRSYTPQREGDLPLIVMEFLSETEGGEYSVNPNYPYGKWYFYERILQVPYYCIFEPERGRLEVYRLTDGHYQMVKADELERYRIAPLNLDLGVWQGDAKGTLRARSQRSGYWLRWWDSEGNLLLWGAERIEQERQNTEQERQRADRLAEQLKALGIDPETIL